MEIVIRGETKEIAALVLAVQGRANMVVEDSKAIRDFAQAICGIQPEAQAQSGN